MRYYHDMDRLGPVAYFFLGAEALERGTGMAEAFVWLTRRDISPDVTTEPLYELGRRTPIRIPRCRDVLAWDEGEPDPPDDRGLPVYCNPGLHGVFMGKVRCYLECGQVLNAERQVGMFYRYRSRRDADEAIAAAVRYGLTHSPEEMAAWLRPTTEGNGA